LVVGPWCGVQTSKEKQTRATQLNKSFCATAARGIGCGKSWQRYVSLRDCATAEAVDGSHFSEAGAATILDTTLKREISEFINT